MLIRCTVHVATLAVAAALAGCASTTVDSQWADPQFTGTSLRGAKVLVVCETGDFGLTRLCQDQLASRVAARGATPVLGADPAAEAAAGPAGRAERYLDAARAAEAKAVLAVTVSLADIARSTSPFSVGLGGVRIGGGSGVGVGVGVAVPIGGGQPGVARSMRGRLTDVGSGQLLWTTRAAAPSSSDAEAQMAALAEAVVGEAEKAGLL